MGNRPTQVRCSSPITVHPVSPAPCRRCGGFLVTDILFDHLGPCWQEQIACRRWVNCGSIDDAVIRTNSRRHRDSDASPGRRRSGARTPATPIWIAWANGRRPRPGSRLSPTGAD